MTAGAGKELNAPAQPTSRERTSQEDLEPSEEVPRCERRAIRVRGAGGVAETHTLPLMQCGVGPQGH